MAVLKLSNVSVGDMLAIDSDKFPCIPARSQKRVKEAPDGRRVIRCDVPPALPHQHFLDEEATTAGNLPGMHKVEMPEEPSKDVMGDTI